MIAKTRRQKEKILEDLKEKLSHQKALIFVDFRGLKVKELANIRKKLKEANSQFLVAKKTLMRLAFQEKNIKFNPEELEGQIALVFGFGDELTPAQIVFRLSQEYKNLKILGGFIESKKEEFLSSEKIIELGNLPTKEELYGRLVGSISAPISNFINVLQGNIKGLLYVLAKAKA